MFSSLPEIIAKLEAVAKRPYLVGIDGLGGAGKSTLAAMLQQELTDFVVVHNDDFYQVLDEALRARLNPEQGYRRYFDWQRLRHQVLIPLSAGRAAYYERFDWPTGQLAEAIQVAPSSIIAVEGVYSTRPELRDYYDLTIWVETSDAERARRLDERNENSHAWMGRWAAAENYYVESQQPHRQVHVTVVGE